MSIKAGSSPTVKLRKSDNRVIHPTASADREVTRRGLSNTGTGRRATAMSGSPAGRGELLKHLMPALHLVPGRKSLRKSPAVAR